jgi:mannose-6-phosphate isomerase-like protein (cupin superfamily)
LLATGDSIVFDADQPHSLRNPGDTEARAFRVTVNAETPPRWDVPHDATHGAPNETQLAHAHSEG